MQVISSKKTSLLQSIDEWRMIGGERGYQQNPFCGPMKLKRQFLAMSDILFFIYFFAERIKFIYSARYWQKSLQFDQSAQFGGELDII